MNPYSERLLNVMEATASSWLRRSFDRVVDAQGLAGSADSTSRDEAIVEAFDELSTNVRELLLLEAWEQRRNPLDLVRECTGALSRELARLGARPVRRDEFEERSFPGDVFGLCPATWSDVHPDLHEVGLEWGAWKAAAIIAHRRSTTETSGDRS